MQKTAHPLIDFILLVAGTSSLAPIPLAAQTVTASAPTSTLEQVLASRPLVNRTLTVEEAVSIALKESPVVRGAVAEVDAAQGRLNEARAGRRPAISANGFASGGTLSNIIAAPGEPQMLMGLKRGGFADGNLMLMVPLSTGNRLQALVRQAAALHGASASDLGRQQQEVALMTRTAYHEALARRALVDVTRNHLTATQEQLRVDRAAAEAGKVPPFYVQRGEAEEAAARQELINAERDVELSLTQLKTVMGLNPLSEITLSETLAYVPSAIVLASLTGPSASGAKPVTATVPATAPLSPQSTTFEMPATLPPLLRLAERQRPELQGATLRVRASEAETGVARSAYRPQVNLFAMGDAGRNRGNPGYTGTTYGVVASLPILDGGLRRARVQTAEAERERQEQDRQQMALQIAQEVTNALLNLRAGEQSVQTSQAALTAAQEDYRVARLRYEAGKSIAVEVLDALTARVRAESNVVQALYQYNVARDQLVRAVGGTVATQLVAPTVR